jgi:predicted transposase YdaD
VVRVWELPAEELLTGPLGLVPLAPVADVGRAEVPDLIRRVGTRVSRDTDPGTADRLLTAVGLLLQLRYGPVTTEEFIRRYPEIREYAAFRTFLEEGRVEGRAEGRAEGRTMGRIEAFRELLFRQGRRKFGPPTAEHLDAVNAITDSDRLEALGERVLDASTWDDLLKPT